MYIHVPLIFKSSNFCKMIYVPKVNDYVKWNKGEGWVYFVCEDYITIEIAVRDKDPDDLQHSPLHKKHHCLILCYIEDWKDLVYVKSRECQDV